MEYRSNSFVVDAFEFTADYDDRVAPFWFSRAVEDAKICIDSVINDGANRICGFTFYSGKSRIKAKCGEIVLRFPTGDIAVMSKSAFKDLFHKNR